MEVEFLELPPLSYGVTSIQHIRYMSISRVILKEVMTLFDFSLSGFSKPPFIKSAVVKTLVKSHGCFS